jgi:hypothetical protein
MKTEFERLKSQKDALLNGQTRINNYVVCFELCKYLADVKIDGEDGVTCTKRGGCPLHSKQSPVKSGFEGK